MKKITESDFPHVRKELYDKGFNQQKRNLLETALLGDKDEGQITKQEAEKTLKYMREHKSKYNLSEKDIQTYEDVINRRMH